jgi:hypothetical protein
MWNSEGGMRKAEWISKRQRKHAGGWEAWKIKAQRRAFGCWRLEAKEADKLKA